MLSWGIWRMRHVFVEIYSNSLIFPSLFGDKSNSCSLQYCQFLLYSKMNQPSTYIFPFPFGLPSHSGHHIELSIEYPVLYSRSSLVIFLYIESIVYMCQSQFPNSLHPPFHLLGIYIFVLCVCVSISALQIRSYIFRYKVSQHLQVAQFCNLTLIFSLQTTCRIKQPLNESTVWSEA